MFHPSEISDGKTLGEHLCSEAGLVHVDVFSQQFRITRQNGPLLANFAVHQIHNWRIESGPDLPIACAKFAAGNGEVALLGLAVDADGMVVTHSTLKTRIAELNSVDAVTTYFNACAGRYAFIISLNGDQRFYLDPVGSLGALYDPHSGIIASTINLVLRRAVIPNKDYPETAVRYAFGHTSDQHVRRIIPNHYFDLTSHSMTRHWPGPDDIVEPSESGEAAKRRSGDFRAYFS